MFLVPLLLLQQHVRQAVALCQTLLMANLGDIPKMMKFLFAMLFLVAGTNVGAQSDGGNLHPAYFGSDSIDEAVEIILPFKEVIDNSAFTAEAVDYCDEEPAGDFFYTYTPSQNESVNIRASGDDTEIYVYDLAAEGSECVSGQDEDNLGESHWYSVNYPEDLGTCDHVCSENALVDLTAGTTYHIVIASNDDGDGDESEDARGLIFVSMAVGEDAASLLNSPAGSDVGRDDIYDAVAITLPFEEIVDNRAFSPFTDGGSEGVVPDYCEEDPAGDFFYEYTPSADQTLNIKASGDDTEIYVYDLAESGTNRCLVYQDDDNLHDSVSPHWFEATYPDDLGTCDHECSENLNVDLRAGTTYHIVIASNASGTSEPSEDYVEDNDSRSLIFVSMAVGVDAAANTPTEAPSVPVPLMPFWAWLALVVLAGLSGLRSMRQRRFCDFA